MSQIHPYKDQHIFAVHTAVKNVPGVSESYDIVYMVTAVSKKPTAGIFKVGRSGFL